MRITGRLEDVIIRKGENVPAAEVEDLLSTHPAVADVAVLGLPDDERGEMVCAVVVVEACHPPPTVADVATHRTGAGLMRRKLPAGGDPARVSRNAAGKALKPRLVAEYGGGEGTLGLSP